MNVTKLDGNDSDSACFSLSIISLSCYSDISEWILNRVPPYHICPKRELFASFEKLDGGIMSFGDGLICCIEGIGTVCVSCMMGQ